MANLIAKHMETYHTKFIRGATPTKLEKAGDKILVTWDSKDGQK